MYALSLNNREVFNYKLSFRQATRRLGYYCLSCQDNITRRPVCHICYGFWWWNRIFCL